MNKSDKFCMLIEVIPRPRLDDEGEMKPVSCDAGRLKNNTSMSQGDNDSVGHVQLNATSLVFDVLPEHNLFWFGQAMKIGSVVLDPQPLSIWFPCPCSQANEGISQDHGEREYECGTEIRLSILPHPVQAERLKHEIRDEQDKAAKQGQWKKIARRCLDPIAKVFHPFIHFLFPNNSSSLGA